MQGPREAGIVAGLALRRASLRRAMRTRALATLAGILLLVPLGAPIVLGAAAPPPTATLTLSSSQGEATNPITATYNLSPTCGFPVVKFYWDTRRLPIGSDKFDAGCNATIGGFLHRIQALEVTWSWPRPVTPPARAASPISSRTRSWRHRLRLRPLRLRPLRRHPPRRHPPRRHRPRHRRPRRHQLRHRRPRRHQLRHRRPRRRRRRERIRYGRLPRRLRLPRRR